ncbi:MAG TPA: FAD-dependent oxidoreductase [Thermoanaerobaculia bacterium]|jgi:monoamine oxidase|nr:FAD-dependent oxidoreductase [Thermoanaerobaculia bacterium]
MAGIDPRRWERAQRLARLLLLVGPDGEDLTRRYLDVLFDREPSRTARPQQVLVVGAGIAGMTAALLLARRGHKVTIVEANASRVGGRIKTLRNFQDPAQYAEAGAMRLPDFHPMVLGLVDDLGLKRRLFYNVDVDPKSGNTSGPVPPVVYRGFDGREWRNGPDQPEFEPPKKLFSTWIRTNGQQVRRAAYNDAPSAINAGFEVPEPARQRTANDVVNGALETVRDYYSFIDPATKNRVRKPVPQWIDGWARVIYDFDAYSMWGFLSEVAGLDDATIEAAGTIENLTSRLPLSFLHSFLGRSDINPQATYWEIVGGTDRLTDALKERVLASGDVELVMGQRLIRLEYWHPERDTSRCRHARADGPPVWLETVAEGGIEAMRTFSGERAIVTIPFSSLRHVVVEPLLSYKKRRGIIELHYDFATKVLLEFSRRWWEWTEADWQRELDAIEPGLYDRHQEDPAAALAGGDALGVHPSVDERQIPAAVARLYDAYRATKQPKREADHFFGGGSVTDNPNRFIYYPSHPVPDSPGGVVLASYVWADDAARWDSMDDDERYAFALRGLVALHGERILPFYKSGATQSWLRNPYVFGEAAVFTPWQLTQFHLAIPTPEGPVHFAGEHTSLKHAWIEGALESAVRAALEIDEPARDATAESAS